MSYVCETLLRGTNTCIQWAVYVQPSFIPTLTDEVRDRLILIQLGMYISILIVKTIKNYFNLGGS